MPTSIPALVSEIVELRRRAGATDMQLGTPATPARIRAAEQKRHTRFPPSYRQFLKLHNGWIGFWPDWSLLGVGGKITDEMRRDVRESLELAKSAVENDAEMDDRDPREAWRELEQQERRRRNVVHPLKHPVLGTNFNGGLLLFDRNRIWNREPEVVAIQNGQFQERWKNFESLLRAARADLRAEAAPGRAPSRKG